MLPAGHFDTRQDTSASDTYILRTMHIKAQLSSVISEYDIPNIISSMYLVQDYGTFMC